MKTMENLNLNRFKLATVRRLGISLFSSENYPRYSRLMTKSKLLCLALLLPGCSTVGTHPVVPAGNAQVACRTLYQEVDAAIDRAGVRDHGSSPVRGFPYLRATRLLASFRNELTEPAKWSAWIGHMATLDAEARALELHNLPAPVGSRRTEALRDELNRCRELLVAVELTQPAHRARLRNAARVPDDYITWWRMLGLYPFTAPIVAARISAWHNEILDIFATPLESLGVAGRLVRWSPISPSPGDPLNAQQTSEILRRSLDPLGIPLPTGADLDRVFATFVPVWEVDVVDANDRIGMPRWEDGAVVEVARPTLYRKVSHTRFGNQVLLQLNYIIWFPARPGSDIYAGQLDGINWRVTLGPDGEPWLYDAIHNCGCYHEFFPSHRLRLREGLSKFYFEPPLLPQYAPTASGGRPLVLRIAHHTHFIQRLYRDESEAGQPRAAQLTLPMVWEEYDVLRSLPSDRGYRSLFGTSGLIAGTERAERFLLWPMGIPSPGAMRQWGRHPTAFVGRRHFDDPFLIESLFETTP